MKMINHYQHSIVATSFVANVSYLMFPNLAYAEFGFNISSHIGFTTFESLLVGILNIFLVIAIPIIIFFIIYGGFQYVTARGNVQQTEQATKTITYAIIGGVLAIGAVAISQVVANVVNSFLVTP